MPCTTGIETSKISENRSARPERLSVMLMAVIEYFDGELPTKRRVRDISAGGMRVDGAEKLQADMRVAVSVGAIHAAGATVRWTRSQLAGLAFDETIDPDEARKKNGSAPIPQPKTSGAVPTAGWAGEMRDAYKP